ncbi:unnamed protein product [Sphagnum tenellum]
MAAHQRISKVKALAVPLFGCSFISGLCNRGNSNPPCSDQSAYGQLVDSHSTCNLSPLIDHYNFLSSDHWTPIQGGGGAYIVAKENLGDYAGLVAGASLLVDYVLTVAVSIAAGVENISSAFPALLPHRVAIAATIILIIALFNLRGLRESASIFAVPTYLFIFSFGRDDRRGYV